jgi:ABC-type Zn uptake system ZnuABC Zn-binding protein ZnuA
MRDQRIRGILTSPYFDPRHAQFVAKNTGAKVVPLAHQVGGRPGAEDYLSMIDYNVRQVVGALGGRP